MDEDKIRRKIKEVLEENGGKKEQDKILKEIDEDKDEILLVMKRLLKRGKISYSRNTKIDGRGSDYTTGLLEEE